MFFFLSTLQGDRDSKFREWTGVRLMRSTVAGGLRIWYGSEGRRGISRKSKMGAHQRMHLVPMLPKMACNHMVCGGSGGPPPENFWKSSLQMVCFGPFLRNTYARIEFLAFCTCILIGHTFLWLLWFLRYGHWTDFSWFYQNAWEMMSHGVRP